MLQWRAKRKAAVALDPTHAYGTVGAVALDSAGHLAAATSTGGTTGKRWGRIGDSPIIGAGTYAKDGACAVSATGTGEYFIRESAARQVGDRVTWQGSGIVKAAHDTIMAVGAIAAPFSLDQLTMTALAGQTDPKPPQPPAPACRSSWGSRSSSASSSFPVSRVS